MQSQIYHEKQVRELCALHALNNLFQSPNAFTKQELDSICHSLSPDVWINPHKSVLGLGNYDINVIMKALLVREYSAVWFDRRKDPSCLNLKNIYGFILNVPSDYKFSFFTLPLGRRHWITLKQIGDHFYNLDSKLSAPQLIGNDNNIVEYLKDELESKEKQLFLVVSGEVSKDQSWLLNQSAYSKNNDEDREVEVLQLKDIISENCKVTLNPLCNSE
ncbi:PREDICTED: josephin-1 [Nicrophorus vespilloides]|uniref:ubiquitinyl hydrolase 1 n=1 Tax=Nicrophorus vespilloides TaxID=110193 RepID=A0ABM1M456_NICVS|nr:PREDICTED: josephin-1 [Nicrophorus vespilloides]XP_017769357.1 PREDICTED: josephin-1 [Nicrophorus vespilloides]